MDIKQKVVGDDGEVKDVVMTMGDYNQQVDALNMALLTKVYEAITAAFGYTAGFFSENGEVYVKVDGTGESKKIKITAALDTD